MSDTETVRNAQEDRQHVRYTVTLLVRSFQSAITTGPGGALGVTGTENIPD